MMVDFNIRRGLSTDLFIGGQLNSNIELEEGCWYLCTDTAELFICVLDQNILKLKKINDATNIDYDEPVNQEALEALIAEVNSIKENLTNFVTEQYVLDAIDAHEGIAKKEDVLEVKTTLESDVIPKVEKVEELEATLGELKTRVENLQDIDLENYATKDYVTEQISSVEIPEAEIFVINYAAPNFEAAIDAYNNGKFLVLTNAAPDADSYAVMNYVREDIITFTKFLMSRSETYGAFNTYYLHSDNTWEVSKEVKLNKVEANVTDEPTTELTTIKIGKNTYKLPDLSNYVTTEYIQTQNYVTNNYIEQNYSTTEQIANTYVTSEKVNEVVTAEVNTVVTEQIETKVTEVIQEKVDAGEISVKADAVSYDTW